ncbi:MAG: RelA/SpoT domain protein [Clostridiales bacterium]|nr:RelA/SpoT domain protein [Clostridiales bacterium]
MTFEEYYGDELFLLKMAEQRLLNIVKEYPSQEVMDGIEPIMYCKSRIKRPDSMVQKLKKQGLPTDSRTAVSKMHDAVGIRIICSFIDNVYEVADWLCEREDYAVIQKKDYISYPKPNGYRSLHLILQFTSGPEKDMYAEIQLRTIAIDFWAALEHQMKYKQYVEHEKIIREELKHCADDIASVDMSMQTIRNLIVDGCWE